MKKVKYLSALRTRDFGLSNHLSRQPEGSSAWGGQFARRQCMQYIGHIKHAEWTAVVFQLTSWCKHSGSLAHIKHVVYWVGILWSFASLWSCVDFSYHTLWDAQQKLVEVRFGRSKSKNSMTLFHGFSLSGQASTIFKLLSANMLCIAMLAAASTVRGYEFQTPVHRAGTPRNSGSSDPPPSDLLTGATTLSLILADDFSAGV